MLQGFCRTAESPIRRSARSTLRNALTIAEQQQARGFALRSAATLHGFLCRCGENKAARQLLERVFAGPAMPDSVDWREAEALLHRTKG